jgi:hypothetical protein
MDRPDQNPKSAYGIVKAPLHLVPSTALVQVAEVMRLGAAKYGPYNWRDQDVAATVYVSAAQRHIAAWLDGEDIDTESGQPHTAHAAACLLILLDACVNKALIDDRPTAGRTGDLIRRLAGSVAENPVYPPSPAPTISDWVMSLKLPHGADNPDSFHPNRACPDCGIYDGHAFGCPRGA